MQYNCHVNLLLLLLSDDFKWLFWHRWIYEYYMSMRVNENCLRFVVCLSPHLFHTRVQPRERGKNRSEQEWKVACWWVVSCSAVLCACWCIYNALWAIVGAFAGCVCVKWNRCRRRRLTSANSARRSIV